MIRTCAEDGLVLKQVQSREKMATVRSLLWHESASSVSKFVDRYMNAALNIRLCGLLVSRPTWLCRAAGQGRLRPMVRKKIKC
jgi:hypothetical protein